MDEYKELLEDIEKRIGEKRLKHSIRVANTAVDIIEKNELKVDKEKAILAGILHDCAKISDKDILLKLVGEYNIKLDEVLIVNIELIHSILGAEIARKKYKIEDEDILNAIVYHTTGRACMSELEKVIFLADFIEPMRNFSGVERARILAYTDIDEAVLYSLNHTVKYLIEKNLVISIESIEARNYLLINKKEINI